MGVAYSPENKPFNEPRKKYLNLISNPFYNDVIEHRLHVPTGSIKNITTALSPVYLLQIILCFL